MLEVTKLSTTQSASLEAYGEALAVAAVCGPILAELIARMLASSEVEK